MFIPFATLLFSTPVTSSNLRNQAPLFTELRLLQATISYCQMDVASLAALSYFVIASRIGNIALCDMFHCMNFVDCIFWIWVLVPFFGYMIYVSTFPCVYYYWQ